MQSIRASKYVCRLQRHYGVRKLTGPQCVYAQLQSGAFEVLY